MLRPDIRLPRRTGFTFCLVIASLGVLLLFLNVANRAHLDRAYVNKNHRKTAAVLKSRPWKKPARVEEVATSFENSPYNAANNRKLITGTGSASSGVKVISWQAGRTLRVLSTTSDMFQNCAVKTCEVSPNSKSIPRADAMVFDDGRMNKQTPPQIKDTRVLVYYNMRTPNEVFFKAKGDLFSPYWKSAINWIWSFRLGADIFEPFAYLRKTTLSAKQKKQVEDVTRKKSKTAVWFNPKVRVKKDSVDDLDKNFHKGESDTAVEDYMQALKKTVSFDTVDAISLQAEMNRPRRRSADLLFTKYYFILAFEWVNCRDYVSDLFFYAFDPRVMAVPVVRGGVNYTQHFPKDTFVDADNFQSPQALGKYLVKLASNTKTYSQMLLKKSQYVREDGVLHAWCQLCDMLHRIPQEERLLERYEDLHSWAGDDGGGCVVSNVTGAEESSFSSETVK
ncbi:alpha-(1,3)-fucosyltransferase C-like [Babylonia areolata]|uniref:alpha-(1,3)-fucosyltransferase C-like n=1 Tax=Babylonia areolata TaxID=304850 RepID=UPI003FD47455